MGELISSQEEQVAIMNLATLMKGKWKLYLLLVPMEKIGKINLLTLKEIQF